MKERREYLREETTIGGSLRETAVQFTVRQIPRPRRITMRRDIRRTMGTTTRSQDRGIMTRNTAARTMINTTEGHMINTKNLLLMINGTMIVGSMIEVVIMGAMISGITTAG